MKNPFAWGFNPRLWYREWRIERRDMKEWEAKQPFRFKHVTNSIRGSKFDLYLGLFIALSWLLQSFGAEDGAQRFSYGVVAGFIAVTVWVLYKERRKTKMLGDQLVKYHRASGEKGPDPIDQFLMGDGTVSTALRVRRAKDPTEWSSICWLEAENEAFADDVIKGSNPHRPV